MDDPATYGPEFHRLPFSRAVEQDLLSDYKVVVLAMSERHVDGALQAHLAAGGGEINLTDAAKIVGCWRALQNPENRDAANGPIRPLGPRDRVHQHHQGVQASGIPLGRNRRASRRDAARSRAAGGLPLRDAACRRAAPRPRPQGPDRVAEGADERNLPDPVQRALPVRRNRRAGAGGGPGS